MPVLRYSCKALGIHDGVTTEECGSRIGSFLSLAKLADTIIRYHLKDAHPTYVARFASTKDLQLHLVTALKNINKPKHESKLAPSGAVWKNTAVTTLNLKRGKLKTLPAELAKLKKLRVLDISFNDFAEFPEVICSLSGLEELTIEGDSGIRNPIKHVPTKLANLKQLKKLNVAYNKFTTLPTPILKLTALAALNIRGNDVHSLAGISRLKNLTFLDISYNKLKALPKEITRLNKLTELYMSSKATPKYRDISAELNKLGQLPRLRSLSLANMRFKAVPGPLLSMPALTHLTLTYNDIQALPNDVGNLRRLTYLRLSGNPIQSGEKRRIKRLLKNTRVVF